MSLTQYRSMPSSCTVSTGWTGMTRKTERVASHNFTRVLSLVNTGCRTCGWPPAQPVDPEGQQHHVGHDGAKMLLTVTVVMLKVIALVLEVILNVSFSIFQRARPTAQSSATLSGLSSQVGDEGEGRLRTLGVLDEGRRAY